MTKYRASPPPDLAVMDSGMCFNNSGRSIDDIRNVWAFKFMHESGWRIIFRAEHVMQMRALTYLQQSQVIVKLSQLDLRFVDNF